MILEIDLPEEYDPSSAPPFGVILNRVQETLEKADIERVTHVHAVIGRDGLEETLTFFRETHWPAQDSVCKYRYPDGTWCDLTDHSLPGLAEVHGMKDGP